jgi:hypothetical protein
MGLDPSLIITFFHHSGALEVHAELLKEHRIKTTALA